MKNRYLSALMLCALMLFGALAKAQVPANDVCSSATLVTASSDSSCNPKTYSLMGATQESAPNACQGNAASTTAQDVWFKFNATNAQQIIDVNSQSMPLSVELYSACNGAVLECGSPRIFPFFGAIPGQTLVNANSLTVGNTYFVRVYYYGDTIPAQADFTMCIHAPVPAPANDICSNAKNIVVSTACNPLNESLGGANEESAADSCSGVSNSPNAHDVWYKFTAGAATEVIEVNSQSMGMVAVLYNSCGGSSIACANPQVFPFIGARPGLSRIDASGLTTGNTYYLRVYNYGATVPTQATFTVCVYTPPPAPANDLCSAAQNLTVGTSCNPTMGTLESSTTSTPADSCQGRTSAKVEDVWYKFTATKANETINVSSTTLNPVVVLYDACSGTAINCANTAGGGGQGAPRQATLKAAGLTAGTVYYLRVYHYYNGFAGTNLPANPTFNICVFETPPPPVNDVCSTATTLTVGTTCTSVAGTLESATQESPADSCNRRTSAKAEDVWYKFNATSANQTIEVSSTNFTPVFMLYTACNGQVIDCANGAGAQGAPSNALLRATGLTTGSTYYLRVYYLANNPNAVTPNNPSFNICVYQTPSTPANDDCANATALTVGTSCNPTQGTLESATESLAAAACQGASSMKALDVWYKFTATGTKQTVEINSSQLNAVAVLYSSCGGASVTCANPVTGGQPGTPRRTTLRATGLTVGTTYMVRVYNFVNNPNAQLPANQTFGICVYTTPAAPANDDCSGAIAVIPVVSKAACAALTTVNTVSATQSTSHASCSNNGSDDDVWYSFVANDTTMIVQGSHFNGIGRFGAALFADCNGTQVVNSCIPQSSPDSTITFNKLVKGNTYYLELFSAGAANTGTFEFCLHGNETVGISEISILANSLSVQPNPTSNALNIHFDAENKPFTVRVQNVNGQEIFRDVHTSPESSYTRTLDMSEYANGIYFLQIVTDKEVVTKKVVKQ